MKRLSPDLGTHKHVFNDATMWKWCRSQAHKEIFWSWWRALVHPPCHWKNSEVRAKMCFTTEERQTNEEEKQEIVLLWLCHCINTSSHFSTSQPFFQYQTLSPNALRNAKEIQMSSGKGRASLRSEKRKEKTAMPILLALYAGIVY